MLLKNDKKVEKEEDKILYHIAYEGIASFGINFKEIEIKINKDTKEICVYLPPAKMLRCDPYQRTMDPIFCDKKEKEKREKDFLRDGFLLCKKDMEEKIQSNGSMLDMARKNTEIAVKVLLEAYVNKIDSGYKINIEEKQHD